MVFPRWADCCVPGLQQGLFICWLKTVAAFLVLQLSPGSNTKQRAGGTGSCVAPQHAGQRTSHRWAALLLFGGLETRCMVRYAACVDDQQNDRPNTQLGCCDCLAADSPWLYTPAPSGPSSRYNEPTSSQKREMAPHGTAICCSHPARPIVNPAA